MSSTLFPNNPTPPTQNNITEMLNAFGKFKAEMRGKNPQNIIQNLLTSGAMTPQQFEEFKQQAATLQNLLK